MAAAVPVLIVITLFSLQACEAEGEKLDSDQIVGAWKGSGAGRIRFHENGRFEMTGIPRDAIAFSFIDPPPGKGRIAGEGTWQLEGGRDQGAALELLIDKGGSFSNASETALLQLQQGGENPRMYFDTNPDKEYGYEVRRTAP
ncbi:hypothetical protein [Streptomyces tauricus]|uniref:hypothetical protein n=1 Tax=Streptomyces tauricus TaxID=68274 RepID=UPI002244D312|nr:hypothetical protein [Streptomyces tauricus]MCW8097788.1 hypothetical protein [Streptomyces tauricus]